MATCARETQNKTHHARSGGATGGPWCVLFPVSRARACVQRRYRRARMYRPAPARGGTPLPRPPTLAPGATFGAAAVPRGLTSGELTVPSKGCRPQKKNFSDTLLCSIFATTQPFGQKIFLVQKCNIWRQLARCQHLCPRSGQNWGNAPPPEPPKSHFFGRSRSHGAHDNDSTWPRAREKRETKRTTRDREGQLEVRVAFCFPFLARALADSVGTGAPVCTDRPPPGGGYPHPRRQTWRLEILLVLRLSPGGDLT